MERVLEPELMDDPLKAKAYASSDYEESHQQVVNLFDSLFTKDTICHEILDLGCGPGDITFRFAKKFPKAKISGIDGSDEMISLANQQLQNELDLSERLDFIKAYIPSEQIPSKPYDLIVSTCFLHHLHDPSGLWQSIISNSTAGTKIFVVDLWRPESKDIAQWMVDEFTPNEPELLQQDFYNSLLASFTPDEVKEQLKQAGLDGLTVYENKEMMVYFVYGEVV
ncbi:MAG: class I SAM-dependent methyltransferase [Pseudomonadales bacterium]|nr:class I SAM-dependent methyltransferase [Pseudomonadales bacterium]